MTDTIQSLITDINEGKEKLDEMMGVKKCGKCGEGKDDLGGSYHACPCGTEISEAMCEMYEAQCADCK